MEFINVKIAFLMVLVGPLASFGCTFERCHDEHSWDNLDHFREAGMVPNLIPCQPKHTATIYYNSNDYVLVGNHLSKEKVKNEPTINYPTFMRRTNYTIMMLDMDAPSSHNPELAPYLHFLAVNSYEVIIGTSDIVVPYQSPDPSPSTGNHRYVWFLFKQQNGRINQDRLGTLRSNRANFSIRQFISDNNLIAPTAGNFFLIKT